MKSSQSDSIQVPVAEAVEVHEPSSRPAVRKSVWQVIKQLPYDATPEQKDSAVQANFHVEPMTWPKDAKLGLPGIKMNDGKVSMPEIDLWDTPFVSSVQWKLVRVPFHDQGIAGDPLPYRLRTDNVVTLALLLGFLLAVWVVSRSMRYLFAQLKDFFYPPERDDSLTTGTGNELKGQIFLIFQTCVVMGLMFFTYTQEYLTDVFNQVSPYKLLALDIGLLIVYYVLKVLLYQFVNWVFFDSRSRRLWMEAFLLTVLAEGLLLLPVTLLVVYFEMSIRYAILIFMVVVLVLKSLLLYKSYQIFFSYKLGGVHLILYFCTLEVIPLLVLWRVILFANNYLVTIL